MASVAPSSAKALSSEGYNQTYCISNNNNNANNNNTNTNREVLFRCGNWCYQGDVQFNNININISEITHIISTLQKQQGNLRYYCDASKLPLDSTYYYPIKFLNDAIEFICKDITSDRVQNELKRMSLIFPWIDGGGHNSDTSTNTNTSTNRDDENRTYFELNLINVPQYMNNIHMIASKTYIRGLVLISIYYEATIFFVLLPGEGDQGLLDVRFPEVCSHGQGVLVSMYYDPRPRSRGEDNDDDDKDTTIDTKKSTNNYKNNNNINNNSGEEKGLSTSSRNTSVIVDINPCYRKLTLWQSFGTVYTSPRGLSPQKTAVVLQTSNLSSENYEQIYCILREPVRDGHVSSYRDVLFRLALGHLCVYFNICICIFMLYTYTCLLYLHTRYNMYV